MTPLLNLPILRGAPMLEIQALWKRGTVVTFEKGAVVFRQGAPADHALLVVEGQLKAWLVAGEREQPLSEVFPGELVGEASLYGRQSRRTVTLRAWTRTVALKLTPADLEALAETQVVALLQRHMLATTARRLRTTNHAAKRLFAKRSPPAASPKPAPRRSAWQRLGDLLGSLT